ncbi:diacylglycerol kinase [Pasteurellaceae bacterium HPA106]|uniref:diacylglycerol kinase n=1 Tax=Spirabiliibacterium pneumoniae TaxID=221400 RepID=UPI001AAC9DB2|nr:diacylglycerol kinase [Spirabiliibacterium pneumoniae]MBE2896862.1 diacylglycerol kinase [Spirabiliibacterium pneumoniae]
MSEYKHKGLTHLVKATQYSWQGLSYAAHHETAFRHELLAAVILIPLAFWIAQSAVELVLLIGSVLLVMLVEMLNSAVECAIDRIGLEHHELSGRGKDYGSAAVFIAMVITVVTWLAILID